MPPMRIPKGGPRKAKDPKKTVARLLQYLKQYRTTMILVVLSIIVSAIAGMRPNGRYESKPSPFVNKDGSQRKTPQKPVVTDYKLYLRVSSIESAEAQNAIALVKASPGITPVVFYDMEKKKYVSRADLNIALTDKAKMMLCRLLGEHNVVKK